MANKILDRTPPSSPDALPQHPCDLPHGLISAPARVLEIVAAEKVKFPAEIFTAEAEDRLKIDLTLQFYFDRLGYEVVYRGTPQGPEVLAVGFDEILEYRQINPREDPKVSTWLP